MGHGAGLPLRAWGRKRKRVAGCDRGHEQLVLGGGLKTGRAVGHARAHKHKDQAGEDRAQREAKSSNWQSRSARARCRAVRLAAASALGMRKEAADMDAGLATTVTAQLRHVRLALARAGAREGASALGLTGAAAAALCLRARFARCDSSVTPASRSASSLLLSRRAPSISARRRSRLPL